MPDSMTCFACEQEPVRQCSRCGRPYCADHGEELCDVCLHPSSGVPSFTLYRGSLLALLIGTALAVWLLVQPTSSSGGDSLRPVVLTATPAVARGLTTPAVPTSPAAAGTGVATGVATAAATVIGTPGATGTAAAQPGGTTTPRAGGTPAPTPNAGGSYTVASGDTLSAICSRQRPAINLSDCIGQIKSMNKLTSDALSVGDSLKLP